MEDNSTSITNKQRSGTNKRDGGARMNSPNDTVGSVERDQAVLEVEENETLPVGLHIAEVADMPLPVSGGTMRLVVGVEVGSSSGAASAQVTRLAGRAR